MRILLINTNDFLGGAARSTYRLYSHLRTMPGVEVRYFVQSSFLRQSEVIKPELKLSKGFAAIRPFLSNLPIAFFNKRSPFSLGWLPSFGRLEEVVREFQPDIVHVNWIGDGFLSLSELRSVAIPQVWTMHDSWLFTGGCHIPADCSKYNSGCGRCPELQSSFAWDPSFFHWHSKMRFIKEINPMIVAPSNWLVEKGGGSVVLKSSSISRIPNGVDPRIFRGVDQNIARSLLGLEKNKKILTFSAMSATSDLNKGYDLIKEALSSISGLEKNQYLLLVLGSDQKCLGNLFGIETYFIGSIFDELTMSLYLAASDVVCIPSRSENFPNMALESLAVGCPVVSFNVGGLSDLVAHCVNGYLAKPFETCDFAKGILYCTNNLFDRGDISKKTLAQYSVDKVASRYVEVYKKALGL